jgi:hypothetical protein
MPLSLDGMEDVMKIDILETRNGIAEQAEKASRNQAVSLSHD